MFQAGVFRILLTIAFEFAPTGGAIDAMHAGAAAGDWLSQFGGSPAQAVWTDGLCAGVSYSRPYGLPGVDWGRAALGFGVSEWSLGLSFSRLAFGGYSETDWQLDLAGRLLNRCVLGVGAHWFAVAPGCVGRDGVPGFDLGVGWEGGACRAGLAVLRLNGPRFASGEELEPQFVAAAAFDPAGEVTVAFDVRHSGGTASPKAGIEVRLSRALRVRAGGGLGPLSYGAGMAVHAGRLGFDYSCRFHPNLGLTQVVAVRLSCP